MNLLEASIRALCSCLLDQPHGTAPFAKVLESEATSSIHANLAALHSINSVRDRSAERNKCGGGNAASSATDYQHYPSLQSGWACWIQGENELLS